ncbi:MAG TPA: DUF2628 domain-containing protein [Devosia sp.]|nr:DUF2628 domain-containing protein [Devosia sp.]
MTIYAVLEHDVKPAPVAVAERFSWFAAVLPPLWAIAHGLWLELVLYVALLCVLSFFGLLIGSAAAFWIYVACAVWIGFEAAGVRRAALRRRGWRERGEVVAPSEDVAMLAGLREAP